MKRIATLLGTLLLVSGSAMSDSINTPYCVQFVGFCDGLQLSAIGGGRIAAEWRNLDCAGSTAPMQGTITPGLVTAVCTDTSQCPVGLTWMFKLDLNSNTFDMFGFDGFNAFPNLINSPFRMGNGLCNFAEGSGIPSTSMR